MSEAEQSSRSIAWKQSILCALILPMLALPLAIAQLAVANDWILLPFNKAKWKATNACYTDKRFYDDESRRLIDRDIPEADFSCGGVYCFGSSGFTYALCTFDLAPQEEHFIHNFGVSGITHTQERQFLRYLIDRHGLLSARPDRILIVLSLFFGEGKHGHARDNALWRYHWTDLGLHTFDSRSGLDDVPVGRFRRIGILARMRDGQFWTWLHNVTLHRDYWEYYLISDEARRRAPTMWTETLGPDWSAGMDLELRELAATLDDLKRRHIKVAPVFFPVSPLLDHFPPNVEYHSRVDSILRKRGLEALDLSHMESADRFVDSAHLTYQGTQEVRPKLIGLAEEFLRQHGMIP